jgi:cyclopropane fatty-acyl-phospholipid synthase-like methyltransferase
MDDIEQANWFNQASRKYSEDAFINWYKEYCSVTSGKFIDLGSGPAKYLIRMANEFPNTSYVGYDASEPMNNIANKNIRDSNLSDRIKIETKMFSEINDTADCVVSSGTLHHSHDPISFWKNVKRIATGHVFVMDLIRPDSDEIVNNIVKFFVKENNDSFKNDFYNSLKAAFTEKEIKDQLQEVGLNLSVTIKGDPSSVQIVLIHGTI